jgi:hypothetical protein
MRLWNWLRGHPAPHAVCASPEPSDVEAVDPQRERELQDHRDRMQRLSDELALMRRDQGNR